MKIPRSSLPWIITASLLGLLVVLASFQYQWLGEVSQAQHERIRARLDRDARHFAREFDRELTRIAVLSQLIASEEQEVDGETFTAFFETWSRLAPYPDLLRDVLYIRRERGGELHLFMRDEETGEVRGRPEPWPEDLTNLKTSLEQQRFGMRPDQEGPWNVLNADLPAIVMPLFQTRLRRRAGPEPRQRSRHRTGGPENRSPENRGPEGWRPMPPRGYVVCRLEPKEMLEKLAQAHFGDGSGERLEFHLEIVDSRDPSRVVFEAGPKVQEGAAGKAREDASSELFGFLHAEDARQLMAELPSIPASRSVSRSVSRPEMRHFLFDFARRFGHRWRLAVTHPSGSLEAMVSATRKRNLAIGLGILAILGAAVVFLVVVTRRAQTLARQQIEFVAGVTHELRTPLAAMRSAGENLADGVVRDPSQVARYGQLISNEGRRLSNMVEQVLEYAGIQSGQRLNQPTPTRVETVVEEALAENRAWLDEKGFEVEVDIAKDLPDVLVDPAALRRVLGNLIGNAIKYGEREAWIAVRVGRSGSEVRIRVEDRGQGIAAEDLPHLFEPFYRGRDLSAGRIPGSGLGLSLVRQICEAQGGRVSVASQPGEGSVFTVHLPGHRPGKREVS